MSTPGDVSLSGTGRLGVDARVTLSAGADMVWDSDWFTVNRARLAFTGRATNAVTVYTSGDIAGTVSLKLAEIMRVYNIQLGPLPLVITDETELPLEFEVSIGGGEATATETASDAVAIGFDYQRENGGFSPVFEHSGDHTLDGDKGFTGLALDASLSVKETLKGYGVLGVTSSLGAYYKTTPGTTSCPWSAGLRYEAGVVAGFDYWIFEGLEWEFTERTDVALFQSDPCQAGPQILTSTLPDAEAGEAYSVPLQTVDGRLGHWTFLGDSLPRGMELTSDGILRGTPVSPGSYPIEVQFTDEKGASATTTLSLEVRRLYVTTTELSVGSVGLPFVDALMADGVEGPYRWTIVAGALPDGLSLDPGGYVTGTPTHTGTGEVRVQVVAQGFAGTGTVSWRVGELPPPVDPPPPGTPIGNGSPPPTCGSACGSTWGDPHLVSFDGVAFDAQRVGELVLVDSDQDDLEIQVRQQPWRGSRLVSVNTATAMSVHGDRVGLYLTADGVRTLVDGEEVVASATPTALAGGGRIAFDTAGRLITVYWPDGSFVSASYEAGSYITLRVSLASDRRGHVAGLLGDADGVRGNDHRSRSGDVVDPQVSMSDLLTTFVDTWRVTQPGSLFDYDDGQSTAKLTDPAFPFVTISASNLPDANVSAAFAACQAAGVVGQAALEACALDVAWAET